MLEDFASSGATSKKPLQETNQLITKLENTALKTKSQPNLTNETPKFPKKQISSDPNINTRTFYSSNLKENVSDTNLNRNRNTLVTSESSPKSPTKTLNIQQENFNMEIKFSSIDNIRLEVEVQERDDSDSDENDDSPMINRNKNNKDNNENDDKPAIREDAKKRLQRLGKLYSGKFYLFLILILSFGYTKKHCY